MNERDLALAKIVGTETAGRPDVAGLLGLWHYSRREYPAAFAAFSAAPSHELRWGFFAVAAWRSEWGAKPLPEDFAVKAPWAAAAFWAWAGKGVEGLAALGEAEPEGQEKVRLFLEVYLELLSLPPGPSSRPAEFRDRLQVVIKMEYGVNSDMARKFLALYDAGDLAGTATGLRPSLERFFTVPPFTAIDHLWLLFLTGTENFPLGTLSAALEELERQTFDPFPGWKEGKRAAGQLLFFLFMLRAAQESFEKALKINPKFGKAGNNAQLMKSNKPELVDLLREIPI